MAATVPETITSSATRATSATRTIGVRETVTVTTPTWTPERVHRFVAEQTRVLRPAGDPAAELALCAAWLERWGMAGVRILQQVFARHRGYWHGAPVHYAHLRPAADPYFAEVIAAQL